MSEISKEVTKVTKVPKVAPKQMSFIFFNIKSYNSGSL